MTTNTRLITLSSHDGAQNNGDYLSSMTFDFREVLRDERTIMYNTISIQSGEFPYSFYNVSELHNTVAYEVLGTTYTMAVGSSARSCRLSRRIQFGRGLTPLARDRVRV